MRCLANDIAVRHVPGHESHLNVIGLQEALTHVLWEFPDYDPDAIADELRLYSSPGFQRNLALGTHRLFVAQAEGSVAGFIITSRSMTQRQRWLVDWIGVRREWRHEGVGRKLIELLIQHAAMAKVQLEAHVCVTNFNSKAFFTSVGFTQNPSRMHQWGDVLHEEWVRQEI